jgi:AcrR family transcriptional regulator
MKTSAPRGSTREKLLHIALEQFAARGFEGTSIAGIADALGLSKQALLHHFSSKEKLYAELLATISKAFEAEVETHSRETASVETVAELLADFSLGSRRHRLQTALLMRELLDNQQRAARAGHWYLRPFLDLLTQQLRGLPEWHNATTAELLTVVYQLLGAINYFAISPPTLRAMYDEQTYQAMEQRFDAQLQQLIVHTLRAGPAAVPTHSAVHDSAAGPQSTVARRRP